LRLGAYVSTSGPPDLAGCLARFRELEARGFATAWVGQVFDVDALTLLALAGRETRRIELGSWVVPIQPRHPAVLAQQALTVQLACGGRLLLGIGASHEAVVARRLGLDHAKPLSHMREYLAALRPLLAGEHAKLSGEHLRVSLALALPGVAPPPVFLAALGPRMLELAGARADGVAIWLGGPRFVGGFAVPRIARGAREAGRALPRIACGLPVAVTRDLPRARAAAEQMLAVSARLPAYQRVLAREGASRPSEVAILGDEEEVLRRLRDLKGLGVTDFHAVPVPIPEEPGSVVRTLGALAGLAGALAEA
jgi:F420-dependent oxidoreductase-like protein